MDEKIIDLKGNVFKVNKGYRILYDWPLFPGIYILDMDRVSGKSFTLIKTKGRYLSLRWSSSLKLYVLQNLTLLKYEERYDQKYEWKYKKTTKA